MVKWTTLLIIAAVIIIIGVGIRILVNPSDSSAPSTQLNAQPSPSTNYSDVREGIIELPIRNSAFEPAEIKIRVGSKITWVNYDNAPHRVVSDSGGVSEINSEILDTGVSYGHIFNRPGVYNYHCSIHTEMKGKVTVVE